MKQKLILQLDIPMHAQGKGRPRSGQSGVHYTPKDTRNKEAYMMMTAAKEMGDKPIVSGPIILSIGILISLKKNLTKAEKIRYEKGMMYPTQKPDIDNILKSIMDALNGIVWLDDKQVVRVIIFKDYTELRPLIQVKIEEMVDDDG